jgi:hypothetical protein
MARRTYIPGLYAVAKLVDRYISRWNVRLQENLTAPQYACATALLNAALECIAALGDPEVGP